MASLLTALTGFTGLTGLSAASAATVRRASVGTHYATITSPCEPASAGHASCFVLERKAATASTPGAQPYDVPASYPVGPDYGYTPSDLWAAYNLGTQASLTATDGPGTGQTVGIVDAYDDPNIEDDLGTFDQQYGLPACTTANGCFTKVGETGSSTDLPSPDGGSGWDTETSLDVETVHALCPDCKILLVEANSTSDSDLGTAVDEAVTLGATEVSNSYGGYEGTSASEDASFEDAFEHPGVVITASAGDQGYDNWVYRYRGDTSEPAEANVPAAFPQTVAVGGTSLTLNSDASRASETVWNDVNDEYFSQGVGGTGGSGCSQLFTAPSWQSSTTGYAAAGYAAADCGGDRLVSDISADADPYTGFDTYDSYENTSTDTTPGWVTSGGTSLSAPIIASIFALAGGAHGVADPAETLYDNADADSGAFYDVTSGGSGYCDGSYPCTPPASNDDCGAASDTACNAGTGFDGPTGLGSPTQVSEFTPAADVDPTSTGVTCSPSSVTEGTATTCTATVTDTASTGATTPTGTVTFAATTSGSFANSASCTPSPTNTTGVASCTDTFIPSGVDTYTVTGTYGGDGMHDGSNGTSTTLTSTASTTPADPSSTGVVCSPSSVTEGTATTCTATVTDTASTGATTPTGTVTFTATINGSFANSSSCTLASTSTTGVASCTDTFTPSETDTYTVTGTYGGDDTHDGSNGTTSTLTSTAPPSEFDPTSTGVTCSPTSVTEGTATTCTATVTDTASSGASTPGGDVSFGPSIDGSFASNSECTLSPTSTTGVASCTDTFTPSEAGGYTVTAVYSGDAVHDGSHGTSPTLTSTPPTTPQDKTGTTVKCSPSSVISGTATTCTTTVTDTTADPSTPSGTVALSASSGGAFGSGDDCILTRSGTAGVASCRDTFTPSGQGAVTITASYLGDSGHDASSGHTGIDALSPIGRASLGDTTVSGTKALAPVKCTGGRSCSVKLMLSVVETLKGSKVVSVEVSRPKSVSKSKSTKTLVLASASTTLEAGATDTISLTLDKTGQSLLKKHSPMKVQLTLEESSGMSVAHTTLTFKAKKKK